jgi:hypothetical protein
MIEDPTKPITEETMNKISIRFFDDCEVRAVWDESQSKIQT